VDSELREGEAYIAYILGVVTMMETVPEVDPVFRNVFHVYTGGVGLEERAIRALLSGVTQEQIRAVELNIRRARFLFTELWRADPDPESGEKRQLLRDLVQGHPLVF
jgi:hypothetical protein